MIEFDDAWRTEARERSLKMFPNQGLQPSAQLMASAHRYAIDYIEQAPVIVLAATRGHPPKRRNERSYLTGRIAEFCRRGDRLKDVLRAYDLPLPLRAIKGGALSPTLWPVIFRLARMSPSTLAQIIPQQSSSQMHWLRALDNWLDRIGARIPHDPGTLFEWAAVALADLPYSERHIAPDLADFAAANREKFNPKWTRQQALAAQDQWHLSLAKRSDAAKMMAKAGVAFDAPVEYAPLPIVANCKGFSFFALQSGEDLFMEGAAMRHCVATYISNVVSGTSRIYSVRLDGKRMATLELRPAKTQKIPREVINGRGEKMTAYEIRQDGYVISQLRGPCNVCPSKRIRDAATEFAGSI